MKKITLLFAFLLTTLFVNAQSITINTINEQSFADFRTANPTLEPGDQITINVSYTNLTVASGDTDPILIVRTLNSSYGGSFGVQNTTVTQNANEVTIDITYTIGTPTSFPHEDTLLQVYSKGDAFSIAKYVNPLADIVAPPVEDTTIQLAIVEINDIAKASFRTPNGALIEGEELTIDFTYTAVLPDPGASNAIQVQARILDNYSSSYIGYAISDPLTVTSSANQQSGTITLTVPNIETDITQARIQILAYGNKGDKNTPNNGKEFAYAGPTYTIDATTLSTNKLTLEGVSVNGNVISLGSQHKSDNYTIYNILGKSVKTGNIHSQINISELSSGVYFLITDKGSLKFVK